MAPPARMAKYAEMTSGMGHALVTQRTPVPGVVPSGCPSRRHRAGVAPQSFARSRPMILRVAIIAWLTFAAGLAEAQSSLKVRNGPPTPLVTQIGYYFGPNAGNLTSDPTQPEVDLFLVSVLNRVDWGQTWVENLSSTAGNLGGSSSTALLKKTIYLATTYHLVGTPWSNWWGVQSALWYWPFRGPIVGGTGSGGAGDGGGDHHPTGTDIDMLEASGGDDAALDTGGDGASPGDGGRADRHSIPTDPLTTGVTPEPETWVLMGTGLVLVVGLGVRRGSLL